MKLISYLYDIIRKQNTKAMNAKFRKFKLTNQAVDAIERAEANNEESCANQLKLYNFLYYKNRGKGLTAKEAKAMKIQIEFFNYRGKEFKMLK